MDAGSDVTTRSLEHAADHREPETRKPMAFWDRIKIILLASALFGLFVWNDVASNPILPLRDALNRQLDARWWLLAVVAIELLRQGHYLLSEVSAKWHHLWFHKVFGGLNRRTGRMNDWTRYRIGRVIRIVILLVILDLILAALFDLSPSNALVEAPARLFDYLPLFLQLVFAFFFVIIQMVGLFWFLSRGGVDTYMPDDIDTRFSDVWGQDNVVERVKENIVFLEDPESIEAKGGYVPSGLLLWGPPGTGKGQPVSSLVMTPSGPRTMGSLAPGDEVIGSDGTPTRVLEVHLLGDRDLFRVSFSDGRSLLVTEDHLWQVSTACGGTHVKSTAELADRLDEAGNTMRYRIPLVAPVQFAERELPLHPYLLGALLGDGTFRHHVGFSIADLDVLARVEPLLPEGDGLVRTSEHDWSIIGGTTRTVLKELELLGHCSYEKRIPEEYLYASAEQRLHLLQGLMDTDGNVDARGVIGYHSTSLRLVEGVRSLVESFGGTVSLTSRDTRSRHNGQQLRGRPIHVLRMALPADLVPALVARTAERVKPRTDDVPGRRIVSIEPEGREEARCIKVDAPDHLYVAEHYIVTHNTLMAEAVAGETGKPYVFVDPGAFTAMFMGVGIMKVKSLFKKLRKLALRYGGVIVFFDEADSLGNRGQLAAGGQGGGFATPRPFDAKPSCNGLGYLTPESQSAIMRDGFVMGGMGGGGGMGTLQALLSEISGLKKPRGFLNRHGRRLLGMKPKPPPKYRILIMMATNLPQALDEALLRPGRIDRIYKVGYPSKVGRIRTYDGYLAKVSHNLTPEDVDKLATITPYATGASIKDLVNEALITAIRDGREVIEWRDVIKAKQLKDLGPPEDVEYIERERHAVAIHEACHAVAAYRVRKHLTIDIATIEKGGNYLGMVASIPPEDQFTRWRTEYEADIMVSLASLAGERMFFEGDNSSGVSGDLESATFLATYMEGYWGMGETVASHGVTHRVGVGGGGKPGAPEPGKDGSEKDMLAGTLGRRIEAKLGELLERTEQLLVENRHHVLAVAHALETTKTVTGDDVEAIIEGTRGPLLDGRMYHEPEFLELAERYHRDAVVAHQGHDKPVLSLPQPSVWYHAEDDDESTHSNGHHAVTSGADAAHSTSSDED